MYYSEKDAQDAEEYFIKTFSEKKIPENIPTLKPHQYDIVSVLIEAKLVSSKSEARRVMGQGGVKINGVVIKDKSYPILPNSVLQKGRINFIRIL
jgi:tyrosyl-tRNA synthetase